ncbi:UNVERIFIED_CONTAM: hypothetical protein Slati_3098200 [Sesamum latifolium]|uniref:Reverse transcriptase domain-containing protein n=1 Tax=Sesamum latifolium TaxID=2727402 RepID=A0AAW2UVX4_9LAMI
MDSKSLEIDNLDNLPAYVCGPLNIQARGGLSYFITFADDHSQYDYVYLMRYKFEAFVRLKKFRLEVENQTGRKPEEYPSGPGDLSSGMSKKAILTLVAVTKAVSASKSSSDKRYRAHGRRSAAEDFQACLHDTGLINLPMQGEWFTWHNCSSDTRSLWKKLDRILINDSWLGTWPNSFYASLNARTSDHSPLVLRGNVQFQTVTQSLLARDRLCPLLLHLEFYCKLILRLATKLEQHMLQQRAKLAWMKGGNQCSRIFFRKVAKRRASKRIFQITNTAGQILTDQQDVINEFIAFYQALLGAWLVIGKEVTQAILDFFTTGRLLKQVNATLLSLIPKVLNPTLVSGFRPISCCNMLYKVIIKIIVQRLSGVLDDLISPSQNAFVPGCSIGDNILLA